jgi:hypothetical protein
MLPIEMIRNRPLVIGVAGFTGGGGIIHHLAIRWVVIGHMSKNYDVFYFRIKSFLPDEA